MHESTSGLFSLLLLRRNLWFGLVWFGLVWFGSVWFGLVWYDLVLLTVVTGVSGLIRKVNMLNLSDHGTNSRVFSSSFPLSRFFSWSRFSSLVAFNVYHSRFLEQERTIILAVVPANQDVATVDILERAKIVSCVFVLGLGFAFG